MPSTEPPFRNTNELPSNEIAPRDPLNDGSERRPDNISAHTDTADNEDAQIDTRDGRAATHAPLAMAVVTSKKPGNPETLKLHRRLHKMDLWDG